MINKYTFKKIYILIVMIIAIIVHLKVVKNVKAEEEANLSGNFQVIYDKEGNQIVTIEVLKKDGTIYFYGKHARTSATIAYRTMGYNLTIKDSNKDPKSLGTGNYKYIERSNNDSKTHAPIEGDEGFTIDTYKLEGTDVIKAVVELMRNQKDDSGKPVYQNVMEINAKLGSEDGVTVYMSNAFQIIQRKAGTGSESEGYTLHGKLCHSLDEILQEVKNVFRVSWSKATQEILPYYYDNPIKIRLTPFYCNVVYIGEEDYKAGRTSSEYILGLAASNLTAICGSEVMYEMESTSNINIDGNSYSYAGGSYYKYWGKDGFYNTTTSTDIITVDHQFQRDATMYVLVKSEGDNEVDIRCVDEAGKEIKRLTDGGKLSLDKTYSYKPQSKIFVGEDVYSYTNQWSYSYVDSKDALRDSNRNKGEPSVHITDAKKDTKVTITLVYKQGNQSDEIKTSIIDFTADAIGNINADKIGAEEYEVGEGIPTTESLYTTVQAKEYLLNVESVRKSGSKTYPVKYSKTYYLYYYERYSGEVEYDKEGKPLPTPTPQLVYTTEVASGTAYVEREYSYTELSKIEYYKIDHTMLRNSALPGGRILLSPKNYTIPSLNYKHNSSESVHIEAPTEVDTVITLSSGSVSSNGYYPPALPEVDYSSIIDSKVGEVKVKNDYLEFDGTVVLSQTSYEKSTPTLLQSNLKKAKVTDKKVLFEEGLRIPGELLNGTYPTTGSITYSNVVSFQSSLDPELTFEIKGLNSVNVHTPVVCKGSISNDNNKYVQLVNPEKDAIPIVLDEKDVSNQFVVSISNTGAHLSKKGYGTRDYAEYVAKEKGVLMNQVKFDFPVFLDILSDNDTSNDLFLKEQTWYSIGEEACKFYVPMYVAEGMYKAYFRSIAVNGLGNVADTEDIANQNRIHYVSTDEKVIQISGKLCGLTLYDISDYPLWEMVFRKKDALQLKINDKSIVDGTLSSTYNKALCYYYTVGTKNELGQSTSRLEKFTFPLVSGSHPQYANQGMLKTGYTLRFTLDTIGSVMEQKGSIIQITPRFYYLDTNGTGREEVDLYYLKEKNNELIQVGSEKERNDIKKAKVGDVLLGIPFDELSDTADIYKKSVDEWKNQTAKMYCYSKLQSDLAFKTFSNQSYTNEILTSKFSSTLQALGVTKEGLTKKKQSYYFQYSLPAEVYAATKGQDVVGYAKKNGLTMKESFFKKNGYLLVNLTIEAYDDAGNRYMSYINQDNYLAHGHSCMWLLEGAKASKTDSKGTVFSLKAGDFIVYELGTSIKDDYKSGGIY